jgi:microcystin-dependent protein
MANPYLGEIRFFAGTFAPRGWAMCDGEPLPIEQNAALFALIGTTYGGDGRTTFRLPDLRGRIPVHAGQGPGLTHRRLGEAGGSEDEVLGIDELPTHTHGFGAAARAGDRSMPSGAYAAGSDVAMAYVAAAPTVAMHGDAIAPYGGNQTHENMMPYVCITFIIAVIGTVASRD